MYLVFTGGSVKFIRQNFQTLNVLSFLNRINTEYKDFVIEQTRFSDAFSFTAPIIF